MVNCAFNGDDDMDSSPPDVELTNNSGEEFHLPHNEEEKMNGNINSTKN